MEKCQVLNSMIRFGVHQWVRRNACMHSTVQVGNIRKAILQSVPGSYGSMGVSPAMCCNAEVPVQVSLLFPSTQHATHVGKFILSTWHQPVHAPTLKSEW
jgi:hypothetical protein